MKGEPPLTPSACDRAREYDRLWAEKHPDWKTHVRRYIPGEFDDLRNGDGAAPDWEVFYLDCLDGDYAYVEVTEISSEGGCGACWSPGGRLRRLLVPSMSVIAP